MPSAPSRGSEVIASSGTLASSSAVGQGGGLPRLGESSSEVEGARDRRRDIVGMVLVGLRCSDGAVENYDFLFIRCGGAVREVLGDDAFINGELGIGGR